MARRCWKHSRQKTGRPCVRRKGTVVSLPHWEQLVFVSARIGEAPPPPPMPPSEHFRTLSWYSIEPLSLGPERAGRWAHFAPWAWEHGGYLSRWESKGIPWACGHEAATETQTSLP